MRLWVLLSILIFTLNASAGSRDRFMCELELSKPVRAVGGLLAAGLERGALELSDLRKFLDDFPSHDPYSNISKSPENLELANSFRRLFFSLKPMEKDELQIAARRFIDGKIAQTGAIQEAKEETSRVLTMKIVKSLELEPRFSHSNRTHIAQSEKDGRPIFLAQFYSPRSNESSKVMLDPFHEDPQQRMLEVNKGSGTNTGAGLELLSLNGKTIAAEFKENFYYDIGDKNDVAPIVPAVVLKPISAPRDFVTVSTSRGTILYVSQMFEDPKLGQALVEFNLSHPEVPPKIIHRGSLLSLRFQNFEGRDYITFVEDDSTFSIYNVTDQKFILRNAENASADEHTHGYLYRAGDEVFFAFRDAGHYLRLHNLTTKALEKIKLESGLLNRGDFIKVEIRGEPHLVYPGSDKIVFLNLKTKEFTHRVVKNSRLSDFLLFEWKGRQYLIWGAEAQHKILAIESNLLVATLSLAVSNFRMKIVARGEDLYALVLTNRNVINFIRLTMKAQREEEH